MLIAAAAIGAAATTAADCWLLLFFPAGLGGGQPAVLWGEQRGGHAGHAAAAA